MRRNEAALHLALIMKKCNELDLPCKHAIRHYGECIEEMLDDIMDVIQRKLDNPNIRSCRMQLVIDFKTMTKTDYWTSSKIFEILPKVQSDSLKEKFEEFTYMLKALEMKIHDVDPVFAEKLLKRMMGRLNKKKHIFDYEIWKVEHPDYDLNMLLNKEIELTANLLEEGVLENDDEPKDEEVQNVRLDLVKRGLDHDRKLKENFERECAKLKRYSHWNGKYQFVVDNPKIYRYFFINCFEKLTKRQRIALYEYNMQMQKIHEDIKTLLAKHPEEALGLDRDPKNVILDDDYYVAHVGDAIEKVQPYMWGNSANAVIFCALRDNHDFTDNMSRYERVWKRIAENKRLEWSCPDGTLRSTFRDNPLYKKPISRWKDNNVQERAMVLVQKFEEYYGK